MDRTLAQALAIAVLKEDDVAAYALIDKMLEERERSLHQQSLDQLKTQATSAHSQDVYRSPEFQAFAKRLGILWGLHTLSLTIELPVEGMVKVTQSYHARITTEPTS